MRVALAKHVRPELATLVTGTTDSEWIYALVLSQLDDPWAEVEADEIVDAITRALVIIRDVRGELEIDTSSPVNLFVTTGNCLVTTRFSFDYGWYPENDYYLEVDLPYLSLWYTIGSEYARRNGTWEMSGNGDGRAEAFLIASEPLTRNTSTWLEVPEYSVMTATVRDGAVETTCRELNV
jgi:predicted glutamine amidotransferase